MFIRLVVAIVACMIIDHVSAWTLKAEHVDGFHGITQEGEIHLVMEWNDTIASKFKPHRVNSFRTARSKRGEVIKLAASNGLPAGQLKCEGSTSVSPNDLASCLAQAEAWCGLGTVGTGARIQDYVAYAWKSGGVFLYVCDWNWHWFYTGSTTCFSAEVAAAIGLVENQCGYGSGQEKTTPGYYFLDDWKIGIGYQTLGKEGCKGLKGNHNGQGSNPNAVIVQTALPQGGPTSTIATQLPSGLAPSGVTVDKPGKTDTEPATTAQTTEQTTAHTTTQAAPTVTPDTAIIAAWTGSCDSYNVCTGSQLIVSFDAGQTPPKPCGAHQVWAKGVVDTTANGDPSDTNFVLGPFDINEFKNCNYKTTWTSNPTQGGTVQCDGMDTPAKCSVPSEQPDCSGWGSYTDLGICQWPQPS